MYYLQVKQLSHRYGQRVILDQIDMSIEQGQKIALVARNGMGKSTLLDLLMGNLECVSGDILRNKSIRIGFLSQKFTADPNTIVHDWIHQHTMADEDYEERTHLTKVKKIINKLKLTKHLDQTIGSLSWGEQKRLALAKVLMDEPDMLILDEPTNHLDLDMIERLEKFLRKSTMTLLMVTHDRYFLQRVCTQIIELERGKLYHYSGNYSFYLTKKAERLQQDQKNTHIMKQLYRRELAWVKKAPRARESKSRKRSEEFYALQDQYHAKKYALEQSKQKIVIASTDTNETERLGSKIIVMSHVYKSFGLRHFEWSDSGIEKSFIVWEDDKRSLDKLEMTKNSKLSEWSVHEKVILSDFSHEFRQGERIGILGKNGVGKSSFLHILEWTLAIDKGRIERADNLRLSHYSQHMTFPEHIRVIEYARSIADYMTIGKEKISTTKLLERFLFTPVQQQSRVHDLSGGEQRRLCLLVALMRKPNFLILDEPTNDLDIDTLTALEDFLLSYEWCLIVISHDRYFIDKIADRIFFFEWGGRVIDFQGWYTAFSKRRQSDLRSSAGQGSMTVKQSGSKKSKEQNVLMHEGQGESIIPPRKNLSYHEKREFELLIEQIAQGEKRKDEINTIFQTQELSHDVIKSLGQELHTLVTDLQAKEERWMELSERV